MLRCKKTSMAWCTELSSLSTWRKLPQCLDSFPSCREQLNDGCCGFSVMIKHNDILRTSGLQCEHLMDTLPYQAGSLIYLLSAFSLESHLCKVLCDWRKRLLWLGHSVLLCMGSWTHHVQHLMCHGGHQTFLACFHSEGHSTAL